MSYALWVALAFVIAAVIRDREVRRLGYDRDPRHTWVGLGAMVGAVLGAKLGLVLFGPMTAVKTVWVGILSMDFTGKTVLGGIIGGWVGVEITKWGQGITRSTGDGFAVALLLGQGVGRIGCWFHGCCYGTPSDLPWASTIQGTTRHPVQLYESAAVLLLAAFFWRIREGRRPEGHLFRWAVISYALVRTALDPWRGDGRMLLGPLSAVQWACLLFVCAVSWRMWRPADKG